jgi:hypothetical protein
MKKLVLVSILLSSGHFVSAQNVGIGTAAPSEKLHVVGGARITNLSGIGNRLVSSSPTGVLGNIADGTAGQFLTTNGAGNYSWAAGGTPSVQNGLYYNVPNTSIHLGGPLIENTTISQGVFGMTFDLTGVGDFHVADNGVNRFSVLDNGRTAVGGVNNAGQFNVTGNSYFSDDLYLRDGAVNGGDILVRIYDSADDGIIDIYENNAYNIRLHGNGPSIFNEQGIGTNDFRIESNTQANMFFVDAGTDEIGIRTNAPTSMLQMTNGGVNVGANAMASFDNAGAEGVPISGYNTGVTNGYNAIEGIVAYSGTAFNSTGVFGLAIDNTLINSAIGVRGTINGRDGFGVLGTRANGAGAGWGGLFLEDLGYTGFFGAASDARTKKDINPINGALAIVNQLNPVTYYFDLEKFPNMGLNREMEYGFIAQEVREILPEITRVKNLPTNGTAEVSPNSPVENKNELFVMIDYTRVIPILTKAVQEQQAIIDTQNEKIELLEQQMEEIKNLLEQQ